MEKKEKKEAKHINTLFISVFRFVFGFFCNQTQTNVTVKRTLLVINLAKKQIVD